MPPHAAEPARSREPADEGDPAGARSAGDDEFPGFRTGGLPITLPAQFFVELLPLMSDEAELRVTLYALYAIARTRGEPRALRASVLAAEAPLVRALAAHGGTDAVAPALAAAARRGVLLACPLEDGDTLYFMHNDGGRRQRARLRAGALAAPGGVRARAAELPQSASRPALVYESEIGMLTPSIAGALAEAETRYPARWIVDALHEAAAHNARSWRYAEAILERWAAEGREGQDDAATERPAGPGTGGSRRRDPYRHVVRRSFE